MFTGIVEAVGRLAQVKSKGGDFELHIDAPDLDFSDVGLGDSIAVNGVCLTVTAFTASSFTADVSNETLRHSSLSKLGAGAAVNLEKAMAANGRFGGHIVTGHVDAVGTVRSVDNDGRSIVIDIEVPAEIKKYIARKGSITVDGVSLTANALTAQGFLLNIVPHTAEQTVIASYQAGTSVNLEVDVIARYLEQLLQGGVAPQQQESGLTEGFLAEHGFYKKAR